MLPIIFWLLVFVVCVVGWVVAVVFFVISGGHFKFVANLLGICAALSLPIGIITEIIKRMSKYRRK
ncbi:MAG TPA: hypothetical protein VJH05_02175 [Candidatus Paceibacterota bacterium]